MEILAAEIFEMEKITTARVMANGKRQILENYKIVKTTTNLKNMRKLLVKFTSIVSVFKLMFTISYSERIISIH